MLNMNKSITLNGTSTIDGAVAEGYQAIINSDNPEDITFSSWQQDKALYKANRVQCRKDAEEFEEASYAIQDEMLSQKGLYE